jgi:hypothetical protein
MEVNPSIPAKTVPGVIAFAKAIDAALGRFDPQLAGVVCAPG